MTRTIAAAVVLSMTVAVVPAHADENAAPSAAPTIAVAAPISQRLNRPKTLPALYASYAALQALDVSVMVASNGVAAIVATRNARTLKQLR